MSEYVTAKIKGKKYEVRSEPVSFKINSEMLTQQC